LHASLPTPTTNPLNPKTKSVGPPSFPQIPRACSLQMICSTPLHSLHPSTCAASPWPLALGHEACVEVGLRGRSPQRAESRWPRAKSQEPLAKSRKPRAEGQEPRAKSRKPRAEGQELSAKSQAGTPELQSCTDLDRCTKGVWGYSTGWPYTLA
jgi:hypothetical protein